LSAASRCRLDQARFDGGGESFLESTPLAVLASLGSAVTNGFRLLDAALRLEKIEKRLALAARWIEISLSPA